ncbi:MAG: hypothetical protein ACLFQQ_07380 [Desulfococcaceae bacterium]
MANLRREALRSVDVGRAILDLEDAFQATRALPLPESSGLVEMQFWFRKLRK